MKPIGTLIASVEDKFENKEIKQIFNFFLAFAKFEGTLKQCFFVNQDGDAKPDWKKFEKSIKKKFEKNKNNELLNSVNYLLAHPPRIQIVIYNELSWRQRLIPDHEPEIHTIGQAIRDIRNNLFHGSKFNGHYEDDVARNYILLNCALTILDEWLVLDENCRTQFLAPIS